MVVMINGIEIDLCHMTRCLSEEQMVYVLKTYVNTYGFEEIAIRVGKQLGNIPNPLQRNIVIFCLGILRGLSGKDISIDARNEVAITVAKKITRLHDEGKLHTESMV